MDNKEFEERFEAWRMKFEQYIRESPSVTRWSMSKFIDFIMSTMAGPMTGSPALTDEQIYEMAGVCFCDLITAPKCSFCLKRKSDPVATHPLWPLQNVERTILPNGLVRWETMLDDRTAKYARGFDTTYPNEPVEQLRTFTLESLLGDVETKEPTREVLNLTGEKWQEIQKKRELRKMKGNK